MRAVYFERHGGPEVLISGTRPDPICGPGQVRVAVKACALNHLDIWVRNGLPGVTIPLPHIPGSDVSGVVDVVGQGVTGLQKGQRVVVSPGQLPASAIAAFQGCDSYSPDFNILGLRTPGGYAEYVTVDARWAIPASERFSFEEWAALPLVSVTAYHMLVTRAALKAGETVLIHAGGSGVGSMAVQLAKHLGATVFTTVGDASKAERVKRLGADEVILYRSEDFSEKVLSLTGRRGVDVVFEHIGPDVWVKSLQCLGRGGRLVTCGATSGASVDVDLRPFYSKQLSVLGSYMGSFAELSVMLELAERGKVLPVIDRTYPLSAARAAQERMEARQNFGKIILSV